MASIKSYASKTNQGPYLQLNEDDVEVDLTNNLFLILDGFGGSGVGDRSVAKVKETIKTFYTKVGDDPDSTLPFFFSHKYLIEGNALVNSMLLAHTTLKQENFKKEMNNRGGVSGIGVAVSENVLTLAGTGNCKAYLLRKGVFEPILLPDILKYLTQDYFHSHFSTAPMSAFGLFDDLHLQVKEIKIVEDDLLVLLTDGAYARIVDEELKYILQRGNLGLAEKIDEIFNICNSRGNLDNQSAIMMKF